MENSSETATVHPSKYNPSLNLHVDDSHNDVSSVQTCRFNIDLNLSILTIREFKTIVVFLRRFRQFSSRILLHMCSVASVVAGLNPTGGLTIFFK